MLEESLQIASTSSVFVDACLIDALLMPLSSTPTGFVVPAPAVNFFALPPPPEAALISLLSTENVIFCLDLTAADSLAASRAAATGPAAAV